MSHLIKISTVCPLVFEFSIWYSLDLNFFENLQMKILSSAEQTYLHESAKMWEEQTQYAQTKAGPRSAIGRAPDS